MNLYQFRFILSLLLLCSAIPALSQIELGVYGGPARIKLTGDKPAFSIYRPGPGLTTGIIMDIPVSKDIRVSLQPGISINYARSRTADTTWLYFIKKLEYRDSIYFTFHTIYFPVLFRIISDNQRFHFTSGLEFLYMFNVIADNGAVRFDVDHEYKKFNVAAQFGGGYIIHIRRSKLSLNLHYSQSLLNWSENNPNATIIPRMKTSGLRLLLAWTIPVSNKKQEIQ